MKSHTASLSLCSLLSVCSLLCLLAAFACSEGGSTEDGAGGEGSEDNGNGKRGAPCETDSHCADHLICDTHGQTPTCQEPHEH